MTNSKQKRAPIEGARPNVSYFKIEVPGTADKLRELIKEGNQHVLGPFDGEEGITLLADLKAGALGTMPSAMYPDLIKPIIDNYLNGDVEQATECYNKVLPLINFENKQCGLQGTKVIMKEGGVIRSDIVRHPLTPITDYSRKNIIELAKKLNVGALSWGGK